MLVPLLLFTVLKSAQNFTMFQDYVDKRLQTKRFEEKQDVHVAIFLGLRSSYFKQHVLVLLFHNMQVLCKKLQLDLYVNKLKVPHEKPKLLPTQMQTREV